MKKYQKTACTSLPGDEHWFKTCEREDNLIKSLIKKYAFCWSLVIYSVPILTLFHDKLNVQDIFHGCALPRSDTFTF
jgi:hypothetical protein